MQIEALFSRIMEMYVIPHLCMQVVIFMTKEKLEMSIYDHVDLSSIFMHIYEPILRRKCDKVHKRSRRSLKASFDPLTA